jgi:hypothetical protein
LLKRLSQKDSLFLYPLRQSLKIRLPYPDDERLYNGENIPTGLTITSRVW